MSLRGCDTSSRFQTGEAFKTLGENFIVQWQGGLQSQYLYLCVERPCSDLRVFAFVIMPNTQQHHQCETVPREVA